MAVHGYAPPCWVVTTMSWLETEPGAGERAEQIRPAEAGLWAVQVKEETRLTYAISAAARCCSASRSGS